MQKIWTYKECEAVETDGIDLKGFKPTGKFFEDADLICKLFNIKVHPGLKAASNGSSGENAQEEPKDLHQLSFNKHRIDRNSMRVLFFALPASPNI